MMATRLYQNTAKVHFNQHAQRQRRRRRLIATRRHLAGALCLQRPRQRSPHHRHQRRKPRQPARRRRHRLRLVGSATRSTSAAVLLAALRLRLVATRNLPCAEFPYKDAEGKYLTEVISTSPTTGRLFRTGDRLPYIGTMTIADF